MQTQKNNILMPREKEFCCNYVNSGNIKEAAIKAGYKSDHEQIGIKLLSREDILQEIDRLYAFKKRNLQYRACGGYERLAFGNIADAIRLIYLNEPEPEVIENMDLFNVAEIKRPKDGSMEIKFFDRIRALEKLQQINLEDSSKNISFFQAIEKASKFMQETEERGD